MELRGILGKNLRAAFGRPLGSEAPPRFVLSGSSAGSSKKRSRTSVESGGGGGGGGVKVMASGVSGESSAHGFNSGMTVQTSGSFTSVFRRQNVEPTRFASFSEKRKLLQNGERNGGGVWVRKQSSKRQQNDWACHIVFRFDIRKIRQYKCKTVLLRRSPARV